MDIIPALFHKLYGTFIRSHLDYSFQAWHPWLKRRPIKLVMCFKDTEYEGRAELLNLVLILGYGIPHGFLEDVQWQDFFQMADTSRLQGHPLKRRKDRSRLDLRKFTFSQRVLTMWNGLYADVVASSTVRAFKAS